MASKSGTTTAAVILLELPHKTPARLAICKISDRTSERRDVVAVVIVCCWRTEVGDDCVGVVELIWMVALVGVVVDEG